MRLLLSLLFVATSLVAGNQCGCKDCKCTSENHCGCMSDKGCSCSEGDEPCGCGKKAGHPKQK
ncbi:MAG: hypothetical protein P0S96_00260 [Simkaniaceae bacterium]|nr:hypothetical protein [Candidatus Sacchlamyda saccharinae]